MPTRNYNGRSGPRRGHQWASPILRYCGSVPRPGLKTPFAPRFGINYRLNDKTVVRGGYGIFFTSYEGREIDDSADIYPYSVRLNLNPTTQNSLDTIKLGNNLLPSFCTLGPFPESIAVVHRCHRVGKSARSVRSVVDAFCRARAGEEHHPGSELRWNQGHPPARTGTISPNNSISRPQAWRFASSRILPASTSMPWARLADCPVQHCEPLAVSELQRLLYRQRLPRLLHYNAGNVKFEHRAGDLAITSVFTWAKSMDDKSATAGAGASATGYEGFMDNSRPQSGLRPSDFNVPLQVCVQLCLPTAFGPRQEIR